MIYDSIKETFSEAGLAFLDPSKRVFWGSILGSLLLIVVFSGKSRWQNLQVLFSKRRWFSSSSLVDLQIIILNTAIRATLFSMLVVSSAWIAATLSWLLTMICGSKPLLDWPMLLIMSLYTLAIFLMDDFARFYLHKLQHRIPWLWVFHQTHHSAVVLTPLTLYRTHPVDILCARLRNALAYGMVTGVFFYLFGKNISVWDIMGAEALGFLFNFAGANLRHSEVWMHFGPLESVFISPAAHQIHHSDRVEHYDRNFGVCLAIWDIFSGSHFDPRHVQLPLKFGLGDCPMSRQNIWTQFWQPFVDLRALRKSPEKTEALPSHSVIS